MKNMSNQMFIYFIISDIDAGLFKSLIVYIVSGFP